MTDGNLHSLISDNIASMELNEHITHESEYLIKDTLSLCPTCYREVHAKIFERGGSVFMRKECPVHGCAEAMVERNAVFYTTTKHYGHSHRHDLHNLCAIEVTDRCNVNCHHCYQLPDNNAQDDSLAKMLARCMALPYKHLTFMGGDPTVRADLPELVGAVVNAGKMVGIYTNGLRLADDALTLRLRQAGLNYVNLSLHHRDYHSPKAHEMQINAIGVCNRAGIPIHHIAYTVGDLGQELGDVLDEIAAIVGRSQGTMREYRIRVGSPWGRFPAEQKQLFVSDLFTAAQRHAATRGVPFRVLHDADNNVYHTEVAYGLAIIRLISWPLVENIDLEDLATPPWASFVAGTVGNIAHQQILREGLRKGWLNGHQIPPVPAGPVKAISANASEAPRHSDGG